MAESYNGWPASPSPGAIGVDQGFTAAGVTFPAGVKGGDVATILRALVEFLDREVESVRPGWCWGYYFRQTTGGTSLSCHASATAIDYNAPLHGYGSHGTWSADQVRKVDAFLRDVLRGVVRWGEHYSGTVDGMHFEINDTAAAVAAVAARLNQEDDMFEKDDSQRLERVEVKLDRVLADDERDDARDTERVQRARKSAKVLREKVVGGRAQLRDLQADVDELVAALGD